MTQLSERYNEVDPDMVAKRQKKIRAIRYKVYMFICVVFIIFFWPTFLSSVDAVRGDGAFKLNNIFSDGFVTAIFTKRGGGGLLNQADDLDKNISDTESEIRTARVEQDILLQLNDLGKQYKIAACVNRDECEDMDQRLLDNLDLLRSYIILSELDADKMNFNQKMILESINEFLLDREIGYEDTETGAVAKVDFAGASLMNISGSTASGSVNENEWSSLLGVTFSNPVLVDGDTKLYRLPMTLELEFPHRQSLVTFLKRVEEQISFKYPILYKIEQMNYDIVDYGFEQTVQVQLEAYYYENAYNDEDEEEEDDDTLSE